MNKLITALNQCLDELADLSVQSGKDEQVHALRIQAGSYIRQLQTQLTTTEYVQMLNKCQLSVRVADIYKSMYLESRLGVSA